MNPGDRLTSFLKVLVQESVKDVYSQELERQKNLSSMQNIDEEDDEEDPLFPDDDESGEKGEVEPSDDAGEDGGESFDDMAGDEGDDMADEPAAEPAPEPKQKEYKPFTLDLTLGEITIDGIASTLNLIRGGRSFKDPNVAKELQKYFESLSDAEKLAFATFLSATKDIAVGEPADRAPDPSDPQTNLSISARNKDTNIQQQAQGQQVQQQPGVVLQPGVAVPQQGQQQQVLQPGQQQQQFIRTNGSGEDLEDTEPPIVVGRRNESVDESFRERIRELIKRGQSL